ncbi:hypothetical protein KA977_12210 [Candidatus Dependentiae bacterium]|nr:hypothetical protein [Candidatus Dependentiae bacterium]
MKNFILFISFLIIVISEAQSKEIREEIISRYESGQKKVYCKFEGLLKEEKIVERIEFSENGNILTHYLTATVGDDRFDTEIIFRKKSIETIKCLKNNKLYNCKFYNSQNKLESEIIEGTGKLIEWQNNGKINFSADYVNGSLNGKYTIYHENGLKKYEADNVNGKTHGKCIYWSKKGSKIKEENYVNGFEEGKTIEWDEEGKLIETEDFVLGKRNGKKIRYNEKGLKIEETEYVNNLKHGKSIKIDREGNETITYFENGEEVTKK